MTNSPKIRARQIISEFKAISVGRASSRAGSSGASPHQAGGIWMNDSEPEAEFQETVNKSKAIHPLQYTDSYEGRVLKAVALAETFAKV